MKLLFLFIFFTYVESKRVECVIHLHSNYSFSGKLSLEEIVQNSIENGIDVIVPTDKALARIEYKIFPFGKILKRTIEKTSVFSRGVKNYLEEIEELNKKFKKVIIIPGLEVTPHYYWEGDPFRGLILKNLHKEMLIIGLRKIENYYNLPIKSNPYNRIFYIPYLWPLLIITIGIFVKKKFIVLIGLILLIYNFPFEKEKVCGSNDENPYQNLINYVSKRGGLIYWAHPEAPNFEKPVRLTEKVSTQTLPYPDSLIKTKGYTGFPYFWEGNEIIGPPGGIWDKLLIEHCEGKRGPIFAIGELDYIDEGINNTYIGNLKNVLFVDDFTKEEVINSLKNGRYYIVKKSIHSDFELVLNEFRLTKNNPPTLVIDLSSSDGKKHKVEVKVISHGEVIEVLSGNVPHKFIYEIKKRAKTYYRIEAYSENKTTLISNPIFVE